LSGGAGLDGFAPLLIWAKSPQDEERHRRERCQTTMANTNPFEFLQQVRAEGSKVTWPTRKETMITTAMVFVMAVLASIFFFIVDKVLGWGVSQLLGLGS
jgi:preprotein translocase subunit SecE